MFRRSRGDKGVIDGTARDAQFRQLPCRRPAAWALRNREPGKLWASSRATARGVRRFGGGSRVSTEKVSNAACPLSPQLRFPTAFLVAWWCS